MEQFLIAGPSDVVAALGLILRRIPGVTVQLAAASRPDRTDVARLVAVMEPLRAQALRIALSPLIQIEPDLPLNLEGVTS